VLPATGDVRTAAVAAPPPIPIATPWPSTLRIRIGQVERPSTLGSNAIGSSLAGWWKPIALTAMVLGVVVGLGLSVRSYWAALPPPLTTGTVRLETVPPDSQVFVDGRALGATPLDAQLSSGRHFVEFHRRNATRRLDVDVAAGGSTVARWDWTAKRTGRLHVNSDPAGARVLLDGVLRGTTPLELADVTVGSHAVVLETAKGSVRHTVTVSEEQVAALSESIYSGWVHVSTPIEVTITEGGKEHRPDEKNLILLTPGVHMLQFENAAFGYRQTLEAHVKPGAITSMEIAPPPSSISITSTVPAEVLIDGERVGETPITSRPIAIGTRDIVVRNGPGLERKMTVTVTTRPVEVDVDFSRP
jgi:hypothetical protein